MSDPLKKIARRLRRADKPASLSNILINARSWNQPGWWFQRQIKPILLDSGLVWDYGKRNAVLQRFDRMTQRPSFHHVKMGNRTYFYEGKYYSFDPAEDLFPF